MSEKIERVLSATDVVDERVREEKEAVEAYIVANTTADERALLAKQGFISVARTAELQRGIDALKQEIRSKYDFDVRTQR